MADSSVLTEQTKIERLYSPLKKFILALEAACEDEPPKLVSCIDKYNSNNMDCILGIPSCYFSCSY